nr:unnamed protein product [Callosobruchus chinensis]
MAAANVNTGSKHLKITPYNIILPRWGSMLSCARYRPRQVRSSSLSSAPRNCRFSMATLMELADGGSGALVRKEWIEVDLQMALQNPGFWETFLANITDVVQVFGMFHQVDLEKRNKITVQ